jgi:hypothetical protein
MAHPDLNALKSALFPIARKMLTEHAEFFPCAATMKLDGEIVDCSAFNAGEHPSSQHLIETFTGEFRKLASKGEIKAAGICCDVRVATKDRPEKMDAVQFALEHVNGEAVNVFMPYDVDSSGDVRFGAIFASGREKQFFFQPNL